MLGRNNRAAADENLFQIEALDFGALLGLRGLGGTLQDPADSSQSEIAWAYLVYCFATEWRRTVGTIWFNDWRSRN